MISINIAIEDDLSEAIALRLLDFTQRNFVVQGTIHSGGFGYLRKRIVSINQAAKGIPFFVLTDLDAAICPSDLKQSWLQQPINPNLLFRVAVHEVEAWLLGDREGMAALLGVRDELIPFLPETLPDPKRSLIDLARRSRSSSLRRQLVPKAGSTAKQGPEYNACLIPFVNQRWSPQEARIHCPSLNSCIERLLAFQPT